LSASAHPELTSRARPPATPRSLLTLLALAAACGGSRPTQVAVLSPSVVEEPVTAILIAALNADNKLEPADSLWATDATVVADGELRAEAPRFAGVGLGGEVAITTSRLEVRQTLIWVYLEYRWLSLRDGAAREGKATVLLTPRPSGTGWRIVHAHSSTSRDK
jgi:hypothetical protein